MTRYKKPTKNRKDFLFILSSFIGKPLPQKTLVVFRESVGSVREEGSRIGSWNRPTLVLDSTHLFQVAADLCCQRFPQLLRHTPHSFSVAVLLGGVMFHCPEGGWKRITSWNSLLFRKERWCRFDTTPVKPCFSMRAAHHLITDVAVNVVSHVS